MKPVLTVEFHAEDQAVSFSEETVALHSLEELFDYVAPGGGCEKIPDEVAEIRMVFLADEAGSTEGLVADIPATLQLGMVVFYGPLSEIAATARQLLERADQGKLSPDFLSVIGAGAS